MTGIDCPIHDDCGTLKCENASICEKAAKCEKKINAKINVKIDAICETFTLNVKKLLIVYNILTLNVLKSTLYMQTLFWRYLWKYNLYCLPNLWTVKISTHFIFSPHNAFVYELEYM